jgi:hypothetical protein
LPFRELLLVRDARTLSAKLLLPDAARSAIVHQPLRLIRYVTVSITGGIATDPNLRVVPDYRL